MFSAGIVLYLMLTGKRPFQGDNPVTLAMRITNDEPEPIQALRPEEIGRAHV